VVGQLHDDLLPNAATLLVINVMGLVEYRPLNILELVDVVVQLLLEYLSRHDHNCSIFIDGHITCHDSDIFPEFVFEISELLI
jgi:hypothetical protein